MYGRACSVNGGPQQWILFTSRVQHNQCSPSVYLIPSSNPRHPFQYYWPPPSRRFSSTGRVTGSTSDRNHPWMESLFMDIHGWGLSTDGVQHFPSPGLIRIRIHLKFIFLRQITSSSSFTLLLFYGWIPWIRVIHFWEPSQPAWSIVRLVPSGPF